MSKESIPIEELNGIVLNIHTYVLMIVDKIIKHQIHIARQLCPDGDKCLKLTQENNFLIQMLEIFVCSVNIQALNECHQTSESQHLKRYPHEQNHDHLSVASSSNLTHNTSIFFVIKQILLELSIVILTNHIGKRRRSLLRYSIGYDTNVHVDG